MSVKATSWVWYECDVAGADRMVLLALADFADESGHCFGSWTTLEHKTKLSRSTIAQSLTRLEKDGVLTKVQSARIVDGRNLATVWKLPIGGDVTVTLGGCHADTGGNVTLTPGGCHADTPTYKNVKETSTIGTSPTAPCQPPQLTVFKEPISLPSSKPKKPSQPKREDVLGKGLSDDEWMSRLATQYPHINIPALYDRCLGWCRDKGKVASRRQFMAFVRNAKEDRPMQVSKPQPAGQSAWDRELAEIRRAAGE